jgi:tungstate transport system ATP-binding protein
MSGILPLRLERVGYARNGRALIGDVTLELAAGSRTIVLGPNGAGKSLLLRLCHGLLTPTSGRLVWAGPEGGSARGRHAMVFQRPVVLRRSVLANVVHALALAGIERGRRRRIAYEALARVGQEALAERSARVLSGGEQQCLALARAWAIGPEVLFLDEPTANLDPAATRRIEGIIQDFHTAGTKIVMTTHDLGQAGRLADEVVFLHKGRLVERAPADRFFLTPATREAATFLRGELLT